ncbi:hypothetical protein Poly21_46120 [Allorhodopirellula heiligendammensis]|uniref:Uncharacterized protein n=1 Tax=Allorhodopirellula heiligendammensis TaxID=2714739 RepID=A0A5C6BHC5_9BACT|nr:hypothetical protein Poly21_46120 [Allorhodopirellula heiligendammensis]
MMNSLLERTQPTDGCECGSPYPRRIGCWPEELACDSHEKTNLDATQLPGNVALERRTKS